MFKLLTLYKNNEGYKDFVSLKFGIGKYFMFMFMFMLLDCFGCILLRNPTHREEWLQMVTVS